MPEFIKKPGNILTVLMGLVAIGVLTLGSILSNMPSGSSAIAFIVSDIDTEVELRRVGIDPESLAASGVTQGQVATVVADGRAFLDTNLQAMRNAEAEHASQEGDAERLRKLRRSGQATEQDLIALTAAETAADAQLTTLNALRGLLFDAALDSLDEGVASTLETIASNKRWACPIQYKCVARDEADWLRLRDALANDRISDDLGIEPDSSLQQVITQCSAESESSSAQANLNANLPAVQTAYDNAIGG